MRWVLIPIFVFFVASTILIYNIYLIIPNEKNAVYASLDNGDNYVLPSKSYQFYPEMRFSSNKISYSIADKCDFERKNDVIAAFNILDEKTVIDFYESDKGNIQVLCSEIPPEPEQEGHFIAGEGGPSKIINATKFSIIEEGKISLYREEKCDEPLVAIHEILHALGFDHNNNKNSVLYPVTSCREKIDDYIVDEINRLYSIQSLPDMAIERASVKKKGAYMDFSMTIA